ncbi:hypothetical protein [Bacillus methanolicus]|nr:hypothetical protein [Bacillus methanolicus]
MRKILKVDELPKGFIYFSKTHIVEGTGKKFDGKVMKHEGLHSKKGE